MDATVRDSPAVLHQEGNIPLNSTIPFSIQHLTEELSTSTVIQSTSTQSRSTTLVSKVELTTTSTITSSSVTSKTSTMVITTSYLQPSSSNTGAIVAGCVIGGLLLIGLVVGLAFFFLRRRKQQKRTKFDRVENPAYASKRNDDSFAFHKEPLEIKPMLTVAETKVPEPVQPPKKRQAPRVPSYQEERKKRPAPAPPVAFSSPADMGNLYEKDTHGSFENIRLSSYGLLNNNALKTNGHAAESEANSGDNSAAPDTKPKGSGSPNFSTFGRKRNDKGEKSVASSMGSLDEYDRTKNPFFAS